MQVQWKAGCGYGRNPIQGRRIVVSWDPSTEKVGELVKVVSPGHGYIPLEYRHVDVTVEQAEHLARFGTHADRIAMENQEAEGRRRYREEWAQILGVTAL